MDNKPEPLEEKPTSAIKETPPQIYTFRAKSRLFLIITSIIILIISGGYFLGNYQNRSQNNSPMPTLAPKPTAKTSDSIANWKTYTNKEYKFSLKYPENLKIKEKNLLANNIIAFGMEKAQPFSNYFGFSIEVHKVEISTNLKAWLKNYVIEKQLFGAKSSSIVASALHPYKNNELEGFTFNGGVEYINNKDFTINGYVFAKKDNFIYEFICINPQEKNAEELFNQILSTFKFTDQNQTNIPSDWKIYTNQKWKFSMAYPPNLYIKEDETYAGFST